MNADAPSRASTSGQIANVRDTLLERLGVAATAWSADGHRFEFVAHLEQSPDPGSYVRLRLRDGTTRLGQVHRREVVQSALAQLDVGDLAAGSRATVPIAVRHAQGDGIVLGRFAGRRLADDRERQGFVDAELLPASRADVASHRALVTAESAAMPIGFVTSQPAVRAELRAQGFNRHTLLCGQSGSGKTYSTGVLLEQLLHATDLRFIVIDPNSDYVRLHQMRSLAQVNRGRRDPLSRAAYTRLKARHERLGRHVKIARARGGDLALKVRFSHLTLSEQALCLRLDPLTDLGEFNMLRHLVSDLGDDYGADDVRASAGRVHTGDAERLAIRIENLGVEEWELWAGPGEHSIDDFEADTRALVLDTGSLRDPRERALVALALFGRLQRRTVREPLLVVVDEAHNVCPPTADDPLVTALIDRVVWAAGEGRKYGTFLVVATQRPQKLHVNVVSQCENLVLMRINSRTDRDFLAALFSQVPPALIEASHDFGLGEALVAGPIAPTPMCCTIGGRFSLEGGADLPASWARRARR